MGLLGGPAVELGVLRPQPRAHLPGFRALRIGTCYGHRHGRSALRARVLHRGASVGLRIADFLAACLKLRARPLGVGAGGVCSLARGCGLGVQCLETAIRVDEPLRLVLQIREFGRVPVRPLVHA